MIYFSRKNSIHPNFSNFTKIPGEIMDSDEIKYPTVEHYFQAQKTLNVNEKIEMSKAKTSSDAKSIGRKVTLRSDWEQIKFQVMLDALRKKFSNEQFKAELVSTGYEFLVEDTTGWKDNQWGFDSTTSTPVYNMLGYALMKVRAEITGSNFVYYLNSDGKFETCDIVALIYQVVIAKNKDVVVYMSNCIRKNYCQKKES